tara:strand:+ start:34 stop:450 length:417 start_codon:yes stop_codon:yes gene_type:complete
MIDFQSINNFELKNKEEISFWLKEAISDEKKEEGNIVYVFCDDKYLIKKNREFLKHNFLTDVITFDYCEKNIVSGDILISTERVEENANIFNVDFLTELQRVMIHGLLHLLGYCDKTSNEKKIMKMKENYFLSRFRLL